MTKPIKISSYPLLENTECPYCGYKPVNLIYTKDAQGMHTHNCWKCKRDYRIMEFISTKYLCMPLLDDEEES